MLYDYEVTCKQRGIMDLDEYLWRNKIKQKDFCEKIKIRAHTLSLLVRKIHTPRLYIAVNIVHATKGEVSYKELLREEDRELILDNSLDLKS